MTPWDPHSDLQRSGGGLHLEGPHWRSLIPHHLLLLWGLDEVLLLLFCSRKMELLSSVTLKFMSTWNFRRWAYLEVGSLHMSLT